MSLVAVVQRAGDQRGDLPQTRVVPVGMPQSVNYGAYFADSFQDFFGPSGSQLQPRLQVRVGQAQKQSLYRGSIGDGFQTMFSLRKRSPAGDRLLDLAAFIDSDGGTPGKDSEARAAATIAALLAFLSSGNTSFGGHFGYTCSG